MTREKKQFEMDEFCAGLTPRVEKGLTRMEYYGDGIIPLLADLEYVKAQKETRTDPPCDAQANLVALWHRGTDIVTIISEDLKSEIEINFLEAGYGGAPDEGEDWGDRERDRLAEEAAERGEI